jgi:hypothetical protein
VPKIPKKKKKQENIGEWEDQSALEPEDVFQIIK